MTSAWWICSSFYFDIIKDRLYCDEADGLQRRSAQTALYLILDAMTRMFAPILAFTCDEVWLAMPHRAEDDGRNVLFNEMVQPGESPVPPVNGALEQARANKTIGKSLRPRWIPHRSAEDAFLGQMEEGCSGGPADRVSGPCGRPATACPSPFVLPLEPSASAAGKVLTSVGTVARSRGSLPTLRRRGEEESPRGGVIRKRTPPVEVANRGLEKAGACAQPSLYLRKKNPYQLSPNCRLAALTPNHHGVHASVRS